MTDTTYVGLDLSLTGAGVAVLNPGTELFTTTVKSDPTKYGKSLADRSQRLTDHAESIITLVDEQRLGHANLITVIEAPSFASQNGSQHERAGLWWDVVAYFAVIGRITEVAPSTLKKFATGTGVADKDKMAWVTAREFPQIAKPLGNDEVDALWLATMGRYKADPELAGVPVTVYRTAATKAVAW